MSPSYCPHCGGPLTDYAPKIGGRCGGCRLVVGPGRAREKGAADVRTGGFMANAARREDAAPVAAQAAFDALRTVADAVGCPVERLRMTDYDAAVRNGAAGPSIAEILATFDTWKAARLAASERLASGAGEADDESAAEAQAV